MKLVGRAAKSAGADADAVRPLTHAEIGPLLGISRGRVWQLEMRALKKIREFIKLEAAAAGVSVREWLFGE